MRTLPNLHLARPRDLADDRLDPQSRAAAAYAVGRFAIALIALVMLSVRTATGPGQDLVPVLLVHVAFALSALVAGLVVLAADDAARARWVHGLVLADVMAFALYSLAFSSVPGAGTLWPVFVLLAGPLLWGWRGVLMTGVPTGVIASLLPQRDELGQASTAWEVWLLVLLLTVPAAVVSTFVRRGSLRLARAEEHFRTAFDDASSGMALLHRDGRILRANPALHALLGVEQLTGARLADFATDEQVLLTGLAGLSSEHRASRFEVGLQGADVEPRWVSVVASAICTDGQVRRVILQAEDITERRRLQDRLAFEATHDSLTGLPNQRVLHDALCEALAEHRPVAVLFVDLDRFKLVNDSLGHAAGDRLLVAVSHRLQACLRAEDLVARLGGDEFVILCRPSDDDGAAQANQLAQRVVLALRPAHSTLDGMLSATGSVGVALSNGDATVGTLIRDADTAMYAAKAAGGNRAMVFNDQLRLDVVRRHEIESGLRDALDAGGPSLAYQPIIDEAGRIVAAEALLRWTHKGVPIDPAEVVVVAEQSALIGDLGWFVLRRALQESATWPADVRLHVNVSAHQLDDGFHDALAALLQETRPLPGRLCLELTETAVRDDVDGLVTKLQQLRALGIRLAIDDFGVGNASLTYLARLPVQDLKIDRSFISGLPDDAGNVAIVAGVAAMARAYGMQIIAEGVETRAQDLTAVRLGCTQRQGYLHHRPMTHDALQRLWPLEPPLVAVPRARAVADGSVFRAVR
jgi:diguanylate cyclase (GGDEF)-like protein/PAS domain S-box-containing protein